MKLKNNIKFLITCDSGAAAGKTTAAKYLSKKFSLQLLTSGLLYRFVAFKILTLNKKKINFSFIKKVVKNINSKNLKNSKLYSPAVTEYTAQIAKIYKVRKILRNYQNKFSEKRLAILEGRDMGILFPKADIKFFFKCSLNTAARRRFKEFKKINKNITLKEVEKSLKSRDFSDKNRKESPLLFTKGAVLVDTTNLNLQQMRSKLKKLVQGEIKKKNGSL